VSDEKRSRRRPEDGVHHLFAPRRYGGRMDTRGFRSILVPLDGSAAADAALRLALRLVAPDGEVVIAHAIDRATVVAQCVTPYGGNPTPALEALEADERDILEGASAQARASGVRYSTVSRDGDPASSIAALARERKVEAIAMGTHGRRGLPRIILGSTAAGVLHQTEVPTFVVHEQSAEAAASFRQILVALDAAPAALSAARMAVDLAVRDDAHVFFAHVAESSDNAAEEKALADVRAYALASGAANDAAILHGDPVDAILVSAETCHANLIALGAHDRARHPFAIGSVAETIVRTSPIPVLVLPTPAATQAESRPLYAGGASSL
jgi:nucleotide-binding universal stress UspA family protein